MEDSTTALETSPKCQSAHQLVNQLLEEITDNVFSTLECDITAKGRKMSEGNWRENFSDGFAVSRKPVDAVSLITVGVADRVLVSFTLLGAHTEILQLRCVEQKASGYCGHYALHNTLCMLEMHNASTDEEALQFIKETASIGAFWRRYWWSLSQLQLRANIEDSWPWTAAHINTGDMERSFLNYLLSTDPHVAHLGGREKLIVLQYAYGHIQNSFEEICEIQEKIDIFRSTPGHAHLSFILGITNHWLGATVYKTGEACPCGTRHTHFHGNNGVCTAEKIRMIIMDSNNAANITASDEDIVEMVAKSEKERIERKGNGYDDWRRSMFIQSKKDQRDILLKIAHCVAGTANLCQEKAESYTRNVLTSYADKVDTPLRDSTTDLYLPLLLTWMDNYFPPQVLREGLLPMVSSPHLASGACLSDTTRTELSCWAESNSLRLQEVSMSGLPGVQMFANLVEYIVKRMQS